jgi:hypothetical protein
MTGNQSARALGKDSIRQRVCKAQIVRIYIGHADAFADLIQTSSFQ